MPTVAERKFKMHEKLLVDVIKKQSGSLEKAVMEGVMNSIEAGCSSLDVTITPTMLVIEDDGKGFVDEREIEMFFETFGQPHDESEGKIWAQFRMGRGQLFAFGENTWRTGQFRMHVDIETKYLNYDLEKGLAHAKGCSVTVKLYDTLSKKEQIQIEQAIEKFVKYVSVPVKLNGLQISKNPEHETWDSETDENAYIKLNSSYSGIELYNLGVYVDRIPMNKFGVSGTIVSKKRLDVNFARNEVSHKCPVWREISKKVDQAERVTKIKRSNVLSRGERSAMIQALLAHELKAEEIKRLRLFTDVSGHSWSLETISQAKFMNWSKSKANCPIGDRLIQSGHTLVLDEDACQEFVGLDCPSLLAIVSRMAWYKGLARDCTYVDIKEASKGINADCYLLNADAMKEREMISQLVLEEINDELYDYHLCCQGYSKRVMRIGKSDTTDGWTDGRQYIAVNANFVNKTQLWKDGRPSITWINDAVLLLIHEYCHNENSYGAPHGVEFYKEFHDLSSRITGMVTSSVYGSLTPLRYDTIKNKAKNKIKAAKKAKANLLKRKRKAKPDVAKTPKKKVAKPKTEVIVPDGAEGLLASQLSVDTLEAIAKGREEGQTWGALEKAFGLKRSKGMTAVHAVNRLKRMRDE